MNRTLAIIGGGPAGVFAAIQCKEINPENRVILFEKTAQLLSKVKVSGGGRCNVTHACFEPSVLVKNYPRGGKELLGPMSRFQPKDTLEWFKQRGVTLEAEPDGRVFPLSNNSQTIIDCLLSNAKDAGVEFYLNHSLSAVEKESKKWVLHFESQPSFISDALLITTGGSRPIFSLLEKLNPPHTIISPVPSLFAFNIPTSPFLDFTGITLPEVVLKLPELHVESRGSLLFTHFGLSGPAVLKLSSFAARELHRVNYKTPLWIDMLPELQEHEAISELTLQKQSKGNGLVKNSPIFDIPKQLWRQLTYLSSIDEQISWATLSLKLLHHLAHILKRYPLLIEGKTSHKMEFVTCGGISLKEVNFKTLESKLHKQLFFAGEVLDIDGLTGGFNFQNAWTTAALAAQAMSHTPST